METGVELIANERWEQIVKHNLSIEDDIKYNKNFQLSGGAVMAITGNIEHKPFSWDRDICLKVTGKMYKDRLIIAGALIAAELDRIEAGSNS